MAIAVPGPVRKLANRPLRWGPGNARKIGLLGTYRATLWTAPWPDPSWEFWANMSAVNFLPGNRVDLLWEMHPRFVFTERQKNGHQDAWAHLQRCRTPVMMQAQHADVAASLRYPIEQIRTEFPGLHFGSQTAYQIALALTYGVTDLGLWGIEYGHSTEYARQRGNCQQWLGIAIGRGVRVHTPPGCTLLDEVVYDLAQGKDYGYDLTPEQYLLDKERFAAAIAQQPALAKERLIDATAQATDDVLAQAAATRAKDPDFMAQMEKIAREGAQRVPSEVAQRAAARIKDDEQARMERQIVAEDDLRKAREMQAGVPA